jgi:hypothetical protein
MGTMGNADRYVFDENPFILSLIQFTEGDVEDAMMNVEEKKDIPGPDGISPSILKKICFNLPSLH